MEKEQEDSFIKSPGGIFLHKAYSPDSILRDEIGDSLLLAQKLGIALYSDESAIRQWASQDLGIDSFCSIAFFEQLRERGDISIEREAALLAEMISKNFEIVPFNIDHLNCLLEKIWEKTQNKGETFSRSSLLQHDVMGVFMRQFGEQSILEGKLIQIAISWWQTILTNEKFERDVLVECMIDPVFCLSMRTASGVLKGIKENEREGKISSILAQFLWLAYKSYTEYTNKVWLCIKDCVQKFYHNDYERYRNILYSLIPKHIFDLSRSDSFLEEHQRLHFLVQLPHHFSQEDRERFEGALAQKLVQ